MSSAPELPPEVLDRLAGRESVTLHLGLLGATTPAWAVAVPLRGMLYVLFRATPAAVQAMERSAVASLAAAAEDESWSILARGRLLPGRTALLDDRRNELAHWVPDGKPGAWMAARFYAESLDYQTAGEGGRRRASGPLPGFVPLPRWRLYNELAYEPYQAWFLVSTVLISFGILAVAAPEERTVVVLLPALLAGPSAVVAGRVLLAPLDLSRWRQGLDEEAKLGRLAEAWVSPRDLREDGWKIAAVSALAWTFLLAYAGSVVVGLVSLLSGAPVVLLAMAARRWASVRREDRE